MKAHVGACRGRVTSYIAQRFDCHLKQFGCKAVPAANGFEAFEIHLDASVFGKSGNVATQCAHQFVFVFRAVAFQAVNTVSKIVDGCSCEIDESTNFGFGCRQIPRRQDSLHRNQTELQTDVRLDDAVVEISRDTLSFSQGCTRRQSIHEPDVFDQPHPAVHDLPRKVDVRSRKATIADHMKAADQPVVCVDRHTQPRASANPLEQRFSHFRIAGQGPLDKASHYPLGGPDVCRW
jgi:hypothetical protein